MTTEIEIDPSNPSEDEQETAGMKPAPGPFAARLRAEIEKAGISITETAERAGITRQSLTLYLAGKRRPTFEAACDLADALGVPVGRLRADSARKKV